MRFWVGLAFVCLAGAGVASAQTNEPPAAQTPTLSSSSTLVLVPALVRSKGGELVFTLKVDDFVLTDDGIPQKLHLEQDTGGEPLALSWILRVEVLERGSLRSMPRLRR